MNSDKKSRNAPGKPRKAKPAEGQAPAPSSANLLIVAQSGRLEFEALVFAASLRLAAPDWQGQLFVAEPRPEAAWEGHDTQIAPETRALLEEMGARILPFTATRFGARYPYGNKIEALAALPANQPFLFFDTDTLVTGPLDAVGFDFDRPSASMRREGTWPKPPLYGPGYADIWKSLYDRFGLDFDSTLDLGQPDEHWERYLYFNAGWFFGADPAEFGRRFGDWAEELRSDPGDALACQSLDPWLDQVILPLVIHSFGGARPGPGLKGLDGDVTCHYRNLPLLYARESDAAVDHLERAVAPNRLKKRLREWGPAKKLIYQGKGREKIRPMFDRDALPSKEQAIRNQLKSKGWWLV
ncbi:hypothetical protein [Paracoccus siganidrum]|uniref:Uncharacterized protein n=1 Tax=Paracoccus siganidrum TaxID=1276757 RepID=A0A419A4W2_9RHOB|nr:hypothetical protein [Paracoccus siganidrum]RJL10432.1 hypothetical protein D3P05_14040 [Paracoccus siganidrum]RMC41055.1 hypothetical protein C9E82_00505 [Paracoccus siganidrum]